MPEMPTNRDEVSFPVPPSLGERYTQYFYGRVNFWATMSKPGSRTKEQVLNVVKKRLLNDICACKKYGVTGYIIEMGGWRTCSEVIRNKNNTTKYTKKVKVGKKYVKKTLPTGREKYVEYMSNLKQTYQYLHQLCIQNGMWLMVCLVNINALENKLGNKAISSTLLFEYGRDLMNIVKDDGPKNILIQPISEYRYCYDADVDANGNNERDYGWLPNCYRKAFQEAYQFHRWVCDEAAAMGVKTVLNEAPGGPASCNHCDFAAYHPDKYTQGPWNWGCLRMNKCFVVSDTSGMIKWLNNGAAVTKHNANCSRRRVQIWKNKFLGMHPSEQIAVLGYYDFKRENNNMTAIKAMGE